MKLKLDENLGHTAAELFRSSGHDVETVASEGISGTADRNLIDVCRREQRCLVTLDRDFSNPIIFHPSKYSGIAVLHLPPKPSHTDLLLACRTLLRALEQNAVAGKLWSVERGRIREYQPDPPEEETNNG